MKRDNLLPRLWLIVFRSPWPQPFKIICLLSLSLCVDGMLELCSCSMFVNSAVCCLHSSPGEWSSVTETSISCHFLLSRITRTIGNNDTQHSHCYRIHTTFSTAAPPPSTSERCSWARVISSKVSMINMIIFIHQDILRFLLMKASNTLPLFLVSNKLTLWSWDKKVLQLSPSLGVRG